MYKYTRILFKNVINQQNINNSCNLIINTYQKRFNSLIKCWKCESNVNLNALFCNNCNVIQKPRIKDNYFKVFGINETYQVDLKLLTQKYRQMQTLLHPDKFSNKSTEEKLISDEYSSIVNHAYNIIQSPINRGLHLLSLKGEQINEETDKNTDQQFLLEIMELNEEVEDASTPEQLINLNKKNKNEIEIITKNLTNAFNSNNIDEAKRILIRMKYFISISNQINNILREKGIVE